MIRLWSRLSRADGLESDANTRRSDGSDQQHNGRKLLCKRLVQRRLQPCCMTGIRKAISAKMPEQTQKTGETVCKAGNVFPLFFTYHPGTPVEFQSSTGYEFEIVPFYDKPIINSSSYGGIIYSVAQNSIIRKSNAGSRLHLRQPGGHGTF